MSSLPKESSAQKWPLKCLKDAGGSGESLSLS